MKALFWNIGEEQTAEKMTALSELIDIEEPNIICIAEGSKSKDACIILNNMVTNKGYTNYYSPIFSDNTNLELGYKWVRNGLKVYYKNIALLAIFTKSKQSEDGRIISIRFEHNRQEYSFIFLHNYSKINDPQKQKDFIDSLNDNIIEIAAEIKKDKYVLIGDFNAEPWDDILRQKRFIDSYFINRQYNIRARDNRGVYYFNPSLESIINGQQSINLAGTYHGSTYYWALFDFVLIGNGLDGHINYQIVTGFGNKKLLKDNEDIKMRDQFLEYGFDHLPILVTLKD